MRASSCARWSRRLMTAIGDGFFILSSLGADGRRPARAPLNLRFELATLFGQPGAALGS